LHSSTLTIPLHYRSTFSHSAWAAYSFTLWATYSRWVRQQIL